jgi:hypothetical protein
MSHFSALPFTLRRSDSIVGEMELAIAERAVRTAEESPRLTSGEAGGNAES